MKRELFDRLLDEVKNVVLATAEGHRFPLNAAVAAVMLQSHARTAAAASQPEISQNSLGLLALFDATTVSAALAIKRVSQTHDDATGLTTGLVDLWGQAEAARCLWFDRCSVFSGEESLLRERALEETARLLAPEAIALAIRLQEPVAQYVDFVSKVVS
jgi:hypothetical protein